MATKIDDIDGYKARQDYHGIEFKCKKCKRFVTIARFVTDGVTDRKCRCGKKYKIRIEEVEE